MSRCLSKPKSVELEFGVPHVDDFPRKELNRLIESAWREPESDPNKLAKTAIGLGLRQQQSDDVIRQYETPNAQATLASSFESNIKVGRKICLMSGSLLFIAYQLVRLSPNLPDFAQSVILGPSGLLLWYGFSSMFGMQRGLQAWKRRKLRLMFLEALFQTNSEFAAWSRENPGQPHAKKIRELRRSTGLPLATLGELSSLYELFSRTSDTNGVGLPGGSPQVP